MEYMVFNDLITAENAELAIEQIGQLPIIGINALTGELKPENQKTEKWDIPKKRKDGKYVLRRLPIEFREKYADRESQFDSTYPHVIEEYNENWFDSEDIE